MPDITALNEQKSASLKHFENQICLYGEQVAVNLVDKTGTEELLEKAYADIINEIGNSAIHYESFDFHTECKNMNYKQLDKLINRLAPKQDKYDIFHINNKGTVESLQKGVFRTNCTECLDRTNVVQFMLAERSLQHTLKKLKIMQQNESIANYNEFEMVYRNAWVQHADILSIQYSGTSALKTDFTRTGKRTRIGYVIDCYYYFIRYIKNNYMDYYRQIAIELFLGINLSVSGSKFIFSIPQKYEIGKFFTAIKYPLITFSSILLYFLIA